MDETIRERTPMIGSDRRRVFVAAAATLLCNFVIGVLAVVPLGMVVSLLAYQLNGPYSLGTNHTYAKIVGRYPPFEVDTDEASLVGMFVVVALVILGVAFLGVNALLVRRTRKVVPAYVAWLAAAVLAWLPGFYFLANWWFDSAR
ncbi:hypothetical protein C7C45_24060 [Micromonospora arborensis]|uniref:Uncharacterized protein n=1 Tax=Micromonospora arborensis TaxID=2116518 RepID=A0A318NEI0_9ACTN|nr:hypothetical protein [Micromonospora arborensis]PYC66711.1 hypothetical protein C7C45_24060 [Micromonospora arborensis]